MNFIVIIYNFYGHPYDCFPWGFNKYYVCVYVVMEAALCSNYSPAGRNELLESIIDTIELLWLK